MAEITIYYCRKGTEAEIQACAEEKIQELLDQMQPGIELVEQSCKEKFPWLTVEWCDFVDTGLLNYDFDPFDPDACWKASYYTTISTTAPDGIPELDFKVGEYDRWKKMGQPLDQRVMEYLRDADWSLIKPLCKGEDEIGRSIHVEFTGLKAVRSYREDKEFHFYQEQDWL